MDRDITYRDQRLSGKKYRSIKYQKAFWLFMAGSIFGVLLEGTFCFLKKGHWETHTVAVWGPFCIIYGLGAACAYLMYDYLRNKSKPVQFLAFGCIGSGVELICGGVLEVYLHMRAWNYRKHFMNFRGYVSPQMTVVWGLAGLLFMNLIPHIENVLSRMEGKGWKVACTVLSVFMAVNFTVTAGSLVRWSHRHTGIAPAGVIGQMIDERFDDSRMEKRFCEWKFLDK